MIVRAVWLVLFSFAAVGAVACGPGEVPNPSTKPGDHVERTPPDIGHWTIEEARQFKEFTLYWVGEEFRGLPITDIYRFDSRSHDPPVLHPENSITFMYGTCKPPGGLGDGGCSPPIQIIAQPYCDIASLYQDNGDIPERAPFRGGAETSPAEEGSMYVWTGDVAVKIYAWGLSGGARPVAEALVSLNAPGSPNPSDPLPPISADC